MSTKSKTTFVTCQQLVSHFSKVITSSNMSLYCYPLVIPFPPQWQTDTWYMEHRDDKLFFPRPNPERVAVVNRQSVSLLLSSRPDLTKAKTTFMIFFQFQQFHQIQPIPRSENPKYPNIQISIYPKYPNIHTGHGSDLYQALFLPNSELINI